jgi:hypothetical protein
MPLGAPYEQKLESVEACAHTGIKQFWFINSCSLLNMGSLRRQNAKCVQLK